MLALTRFVFLYAAVYGAYGVASPFLPAFVNERGLPPEIVMAQTSDVLALALVQPLHGITFALLHLACMRLIARSVPQGLEGTAQAIYATVGIGAATALLTFVSGILYSGLGAQGFFVMAALCASALPLTYKLRHAT